MPRPPRPRRPRRLNARWLITGNATPRILHHHQRAYLTPHRAGDHPKRYVAGQRLQLKPYVPGPTEAQITIVQALGPADRFTLGQVDYQMARELGHIRVDQFRMDWVEANDGDWLDRTAPTSDTELLERFDRRWAAKPAWFLRFNLENHVAAPRFLAWDGHPAGTYRVGADNRWEYVEREEDSEGDRGYTSVASRSDMEEPEALTDAEYRTHVEANRDLTHAQWVALGRATKLRERRRPPKHQRKAA
jgi:hypothetical protein